MSNTNSNGYSNGYSNVVVDIGDGTAVILTNRELEICKKYSEREQEKIKQLEAENEQLKKKLEPIKDVYDEYKNSNPNTSLKDYSGRMWNAIKKSVEDK